jgi:hypothetical protein
MYRLAIPLSLSILLTLTGIAGAQPPELVPDAELFSSAEGPWVVKIELDDWQPLKVLS